MLAMKRAEKCSFPWYQIVIPTPSVNRGKNQSSFAAVLSVGPTAFMRMIFFFKQKLKTNKKSNRNPGDIAYDRDKK